MNNLLRLVDCTPEEITQILDLADQLKYESRHDIAHTRLSGKSLGLIFHPASTRTRVSFETGIYQLGGQSQYLSADDMQIFNGEPVQDTARTLSRYLSGVVIRTRKQQELEEFAKYSTVPIINGMTDLAHPCQVLADLMTIREKYGVLNGLKAAYVGSGNNVCNSFIVGALKMGMKVSVATPPGYGPDNAAKNFAKGNPDCEYSYSPTEAVKDADVVVTGSLLPPGEKASTVQMQKVFRGFTVSEHMLSAAKPDVLLQHSLPANRGFEITEETFEKHSEEIFEEAENRLHVQKAVMVLLMGRGAGKSEPMKKEKFE